jgi:translation initiation factor IF-3
MELDLIEINPKSNPPVLKIADYSKYLYELKKQAKARKQNKTELKEISLSVNISMHDLEIKANKAKEFISKGDKVKVTLMMKKRELVRREENKKSILQFILLLSDVATPESMPKDEGNKTTVILKKKPQC